MNSEAHVFPIPVSTSNIQAMAYQQLPSQCRHNLQLLWMTVDARILPSLLVLASVIGHGRLPADSRSTPQNIPDLNVSCLPTILHNCTRALSSFSRSCRCIPCTHVNFCSSLTLARFAAARLVAGSPLTISCNPKKIPRNLCANPYNNFICGYMGHWQPLSRSSAG